MVEDKVPTVTVIGTCRVHDTLNEVQSLGLIKLDNGGMNSFVHSLPEILLRLEVLSRKSEYLENIVDIQVGTRSGIKLRPEENFDFRSIDIVVIEISSLKAIFYQEHPLQFNEVNRHLCTPNGEFGNKLRDEINLAFKNRSDNIKTPNIPYPESIPTKYRKIISGLTPMLMNEESIHSYLGKIIHFVDEKPILFVNHINIEGHNGEIIPSRNKLCKTVSKFCKNNNFPLFEPAELFRKYEKRDLLAKDGKDLAHYSKTALETVGSAQYNRIIKIYQKINSSD
jgi:hypothetical protein